MTVLLLLGALRSFGCEEYHQNWTFDYEISLPFHCKIDKKLQHSCLWYICNRLILITVDSVYSLEKCNYRLLCIFAQTRNEVFREAKPKKVAFLFKPAGMRVDLIRKIHLFFQSNV